MTQTQMAPADEYVSYELSQEDRDYLGRIEHNYSARLQGESSLPITVDKVLAHLKEAHNNSQEVPLFSFNALEREAIGILCESGEATVYRNPDGHLCVKYHKPSFLDLLNIYF